MAPTTSDPVINQAPVPVRPTAVDGQGIERIVGPPVDNWQPAQVEPTDDQIRRMDEHNAREEARREERTGVLAEREAAVTDTTPVTSEPPVEPVTPVEPETPVEPTAPAEPVEPDTVPPVEATPETPAETPAAEERVF